MEKLSQAMLTILKLLEENPGNPICVSMSREMMPCYIMGQEAEACVISGFKKRVLALNTGDAVYILNIDDPDHLEKVE